MAKKAVASMKDIDNQLAQYAKKAKANVKEVGSAVIKLKKGKFIFKDEIIGPELAVIVLGFVRANDYYDKDYDPDEATPPACFARSEDGEDMQPHESAPAKQAEWCNGCWADAFGTAKIGGGKACRNSYRLAVLEAEADPESAEIAFMSVPPSSMKAWDKYVNELADKHGLPPFAVVTRFSFDDEVDYQKIYPELDKKVTAKAKLAGIIERQEGVLKELMRTPDVSNYEAPNGGKKKTANKKAASKKKATRKASSKKTSTKKKRGSKFSA